MIRQLIKIYRATHRALLCPLGMHHWQPPVKNRRIEKGTRQCRHCQRKEHLVQYWSGGKAYHWRRVG